MIAAVLYWVAVLVTLACYTMLRFTATRIGTTPVATFSCWHARLVYSG